ncbi:glycosyltransferase family 2 protein [Vibrio vulnificus]|nr:glycosyltransferase family 2 protein [Vibrio vulnificus]EMA2414142.1 glycosyltransferase family 2 protein [Vibrio vulnificus]MCU8102710.1 glycosyltransferase family 2 protein [Vibrio vulnificus]HAS8312846.1 glycosyltransferase family 2 protein [Vibrio vulnificus]
MNIYISVVSHGHFELIESLGCLIDINRCKNIRVIVKNNKYDEFLIDYCNEHGILVIDGEYNKGFGENNNIVFNYYYSNFGVSDDDIFVILNPDVLISKEVVLDVSSKMVDDGVMLSTINLFRDVNKLEYDNAVRKFPKFRDFVGSFLGTGNKTILDKSRIEQSTDVDWAAGSCLFFSAKHYQALKGFDQNYFMYCEDIDICYRSNKLLNERLIYYPYFHAIHLAKHANRKVFSKHFYWHVSSILKFISFKLLSNNKRKEIVDSCVICNE